MLDYEIMCYEIHYFDGLSWRSHAEVTEEKAIEFIRENGKGWLNYRLLKKEIANAEDLSKAIDERNLK
ncbi:MAG: hypothetical protein J6A83_08950 [Clostridia bacterium]|nr:hypothetical protein [Clostridia bacterium]